MISFNVLEKFLNICCLSMKHVNFCKNSQKLAVWLIDKYKQKLI